MTSWFRRASALLLMTAAAGVVACSDRQVEDETPGRVSPAADTMGMQDTTGADTAWGADTTWGADTADVDMNPPGGANPGQSGTDASEAGSSEASGTASGGTTVNFEEGVAIDASGAETEIGGVTSGDVTIREGAAEEGAASGEGGASAEAGTSTDGTAASQ
jgi:hypothetical protein